MAAILFLWLPVSQRYFHDTLHEVKKVIQSTNILERSIKAGNTDSMSEGVKRRAKKTAANQESGEKEAKDGFDKKEQQR